MGTAPPDLADHGSLLSKYPSHLTGPPDIQPSSTRAGMHDRAFFAPQAAPGTQNAALMHDRAAFQTLANAVRQRREALGLSQIEAAELARCSTRFVHMVEAGKPTVRLDKLLDLLQVLGLGLRVQRGAPLTVGPDARSRPPRRPSDGRN